MLILLLAVVAGVLIGLATGGRLGGLGDFRLRLWPLLLVAIAVELVLGDLPTGPRWVLAVAACGAAAFWCLLNRPDGRRFGGIELIGVGAALNAVVTAANSGMPVSRRALVEAHLGAISNVAKGHLYKHVPMTGHTPLRALADIIPIATMRTVVSLGDIAMLAGITVTVALATRSTPMGGVTPDCVESTALPRSADRQLPAPREFAKGT